MLLKLAYWLVYKSLVILGLDNWYNNSVHVTLRMSIRDLCYHFEKRMLIFSYMIIGYAIMAFVCVFNIIIVSIFRVSFLGFYYAACFLMSFIESIVKIRYGIQMMGIKEMSTWYTRQVTCQKPAI